MTNTNEKKLQDTVKKAEEKEEKVQAALFSVASKTFENPGMAVYQMMKDAMFQGTSSTISNLRHEPELYGPTKVNSEVEKIILSNQAAETFSNYAEAALTAIQARDDLACCQDPIKTRKFETGYENDRSRTRGQGR